MEKHTLNFLCKSDFPTNSSTQSNRVTISFRSKKGCNKLVRNKRFPTDVQQ